MHTQQPQAMLLWVTLLSSLTLSLANHFPTSHLHPQLTWSTASESAKGPIRVELRKRDHPMHSSFTYGKDKIRGVNIGGWLVTEPWIVPSLYNTGNPKIIDEYTFGQYLGRAEAAKRLRAHWKSFYQEKDFQTIKSYGLNHVRIPIGYWAFDISAGEPYVQGQYEYLLKAVKWAGRSGLKVMIDIHGAPGSQNGFDNSGQKGPINWPNKKSNIARTEAVLSILAKEFSKAKYAGTVTSLEALNEPAGFAGQKVLDAIRQYYYDGYQIVRYPVAKGPQSDLLYTIHDAFQPLSTWANAFPPPQYQGVALDTHIYTVFETSQLEMDDNARAAAYCGMAEALEKSNSKIWTFVGEFTPAPTDCAPRLNGQGTGARYDGTFMNSPRIGSCQGKSGSASSFSQEYKNSLARFFEVQTTVYEKASGWFMWTFKAENADDWSYDAGVKGGWIPGNLPSKTQGNPCG